MILYEEIYFEITISGAKNELKKYAKSLKDGALDDFFEMSPSFINYDDEFSTVGDDEESSFVLSNDDFGIEIDELDTDEFISALCLGSDKLEISGHIYDINDEECNFESPMGTSDYKNPRKAIKFNDELDEIMSDEEEFEE